MVAFSAATAALGRTGGGQVAGDNGGAVFQHLANFRQAPARQSEIQHHQDDHHPAHLIKGERVVEIHLRHGVRHGAGRCYDHHSGGGGQGQQGRGAEFAH
jgi:hypothetical protein